MIKDIARLTSRIESSEAELIGRLDRIIELLEQLLIVDSERRSSRLITGVAADEPAA